MVESDEIIKEISLKLQEQYNRFLEAVEEENESINKFADMLKENGEGGLHPDDLGDLGRRIERTNFYHGQKSGCIQIAYILKEHGVDIGKLENCFRRD